MAVITTRFHEQWFTARFAFRMLLEPISDRPIEPDDRRVVEKAMALDGLHFDHEDPAASIRIARGLLEVSSQLRVDLASSENSRDISLRNHLPDLDELLHAVIEGTASEDQECPST